MAKHHLELETNEVQQVLNVLAMRPFNEIAQLIQKITQQLQQSEGLGNGSASKSLGSANSTPGV